MSPISLINVGAFRSAAGQGSGLFQGLAQRVAVKRVTAQPIQHDPNLLFGRVMLAGCPPDVFDDLLPGAFRCLSRRPLLGGYDEQ